MKTYRFYKEFDRWYIDLPEWDGHKEELEMVCGADTMLDILACTDDEVYLTLSIEKINGFDEIKLVSEADDIGCGAYYHITKLNGIDYGLDIWLCDVTKYVFGNFPETIYIRKQYMF